ncbi:MAG: hypothetical protein ACXAC2_17985, partial [Candidatus Kariarchaeaceae archaeon]
MRLLNKSFAIIVIFSLFLVLTNILATNSSPNSYRTFEPNSTLADDSIFNINITVTSPTGFTLANGTPIIIKLSEIASNFPESADPFGIITEDEENDDIKWDGAYVMYEDALIPSQVDDIDTQPGFSGGDELLFQLPTSLASDASTVFSLYIGSKAIDLPAPRFEEVATVYEYPKIKAIQEQHGIEMIDESYYIENGVIQTAALVEAAWSSGGFYELSILESGWDTVKMGYKFDWESWKWSRMAGIEQFVENNQAALVNPFYTTRIITGPVRAQLQMQSLAPYGKAGSSWGTKPGVYGLVTYDMFAYVPWLDYTLEMVGTNAANYPDYEIELWNRNYGGGAYSTNHDVYIPGLGYQERDPNDLDIHYYQDSQFSESWYLKKIDESSGYSYFCPGGCTEDDRPPGWTDTDMLKAGHGVIFDDTGFGNVSWYKGSQRIKVNFDAMQSPFRARYVPFDKTITDNAVVYMGEKYQQFTSPNPALGFTISNVSLLEVPFEFISVSKPDVSFDNDTKLLQIANITAESSDQGVINDSFIANLTYQILHSITKSQTSISGDLTWNSVDQKWEALNVDVSSLSFNQTAYVVIVYVDTQTSTGKSPYSDPFPEIAKPPDLNPPIISVPCIQTPSEAIKFSMMVNVSCVVKDDEGDVSEVILSYNNGSWYNVSMNFGFGSYSGTIQAPQPAGATIEYKIIAYD